MYYSNTERKSGICYENQPDKITVEQTDYFVARQVIPDNELAELVQNYNNTHYN